jgi:hypothetical protein
MTAEPGERAAPRTGRGALASVRRAGNRYQTGVFTALQNSYNLDTNFLLTTAAHL